MPLSQRGNKFHQMTLFLCEESCMFAGEKRGLQQREEEGLQGEAEGSSFPGCGDVVGRTGERQRDRDLFRLEG